MNPNRSKLIKYYYSVYVLHIYISIYILHISDIWIVLFWERMKYQLAPFPARLVFASSSLFTSTPLSQPCSTGDTRWGWNGWLSLVKQMTTGHRQLGTERSSFRSSLVIIVWLILLDSAVVSHWCRLVHYIFLPQLFADELHNCYGTPSQGWVLLVKPLAVRSVTFVHYTDVIHVHHPWCWWSQASKTAAGALAGRAAPRRSLTAGRSFYC